MTTYWLMYLFPAIASMGSYIKQKRSSFIIWLIYAVVFILLIGFRYQVGGDWYNYLYHYEREIGQGLKDILIRGDPGYVFLNWWMAQWGLEIYGVNLICGMIFITGLFVFCRQQPLPWIAFAVAIPYLVIVVAMGYTRQGVALGFLFWALASLENGRFKQYLIYIIGATLFHKTALIMIPLGLFLYGRGWIMRALAVLITAYVLWDLLVSHEQEYLWRVYVTEQLISEGARIRAWMNFVPSVLLIIYLRKWKQFFPNYWFWFWLAIGSIAGVILVDYASTAVDRVALYFTPIQVAVFSRLPYLARKQLPPKVTQLGIILGYTLVLFVWLNFASHAPYWLPYRNYLFL